MGAESCPKCGAKVYAEGSSTTSAPTTVLGTQVTGKSGLFSRMIRAIKAEPQLYEEVEHDQKANMEVVLIVGIIAVAQAIGLSLERIILNAPLSGILLQSIIGLVGTVIGIAVWSYLLYFVGTKGFQGKATVGEVWRTAGYARSPGVFYIIPIVGQLAIIWMIYTSVIAARQALDVSTGKAVLASIISFIPFVVILAFLQF